MKTILNAFDQHFVTLGPFINALYVDDGIELSINVYPTQNNKGANRL